jgi:hypothetical protein
MGMNTSAWFRIVFTAKLLAIIALTSCEKDIRLNIKDEGGKLVLFAFIQPDSSLNISLTKSTGIFSTSSYHLIQNGTIRLYRNGFFTGDLPYPNQTTWGNWPSIRFKQGDTVKIGAYDDAENLVTGTTVIPYSVPIQKIDTIRETIPGNDGFPKIIMNLGIHLTDEALNNNYYQLHLFDEYWKVENNILVHHYDTISFSKDDKVFYNQDQAATSFGNIDFQGLFTDQKINGLNHRLKINLPISYFEPQPEITNRHLRIVLYHLSEDYYLYMRSRIISNAYGGMPIFEPVKIHNNVSQGKGVIASLTATKASLTIKQP